MIAQTRPAVCSVSLDLSQVAGASQNVMISATAIKSFTATPLDCGSNDIEYQVTYTPTSATPNLITLPTPTSTSIVFAQSTNIADANQYTVTVDARIAGSLDWLTLVGTATATYTMIDPCPTTSISTYPATIENLVAFAGYTVESKNNYTFNDAVSVSGTLSSDLCGDKQLAFQLNGTTTSYL
jgi:hypothetical protein